MDSQIKSWHLLLCHGVVKSGLLNLQLVLLQAHEKESVQVGNPSCWTHVSVMDIDIDTNIDIDVVIKIDTNMDIFII